MDLALVVLSRALLVIYGMKYFYSKSSAAENMAFGCSGISTAVGGPALAESPVIVGANDEQKKKYLGRLGSYKSSPWVLMTT